MVRCTPSRRSPSSAALVVTRRSAVDARIGPRPVPTDHTDWPVRGSVPKTSPVDVTDRKYSGREARPSSGLATEGDAPGGLCPAFSPGVRVVADQDGPSFRIGLIRAEAAAPLRDHDPVGSEHEREGRGALGLGPEQPCTRGTVDGDDHAEAAGRRLPRRSGQDTRDEGGNHQEPPRPSHAGSQAQETGVVVSVPHSEPRGG